MLWYFFAKMQRKGKKNRKKEEKKKNEIQLTEFKPLRWYVCTEKTQNSAAWRRVYASVQPEQFQRVRNGRKTNDHNQRIM